MTQTQDKPQVPEGWDSVRDRLRREVDELGAQAVHWALDGMKSGVQSAVTHPVEFAPLGVAAAAAVGAGLTDYTEFGWPTMVVLIGVAGWVLWRNAPSRRARRAIGRWTRRAYYSLSATAALVYLVAAMLTGPFAAFTGPMLGWSTASLTVGWWLRDGRRPWRRREAPPAPAAVDEEAERISRLQAAFKAWWATEIAINPAGVLPGTDLIDVECDDEADRATIVLARNQTTASARQARVLIAARRGIAASLVEIEPLPDQREDRARIAMYRDDPLQKPRLFAGPDIDLETGLMRVGTYADRRPAKVRLWMPRSGTWSELVSGTSGSGKSRYLDLALATERHAINPKTGRPLIVSWAADPQEGQSLPDWQDDALDRFEPSVEGGLELLEDFYAEILRRSRMLARLKWSDDKGRVRTGLSFYDPLFLADLGIDLPIHSLTLEEAHKILKIERAVTIVEDCVKMIRKCGGRLRLVTQVPSILELGGSLVIRPLLASMNVVCLRTADAITDNSFNLPGDPSKLPAVFPDGSTTGGLGYIGGGDMRPARARIDYVDDPFHWATTGETPHMPASTSAGAATTVSSESGASAPGRQDEATDETPQDQIDEQQDQGPDTEPEPEVELPARDKILALLHKHGRQMTSGLLAAQGQLPPSTVSQTLKRMTEAGQVVKVAHGVYALPGSDAAAFWGSDESAA